MLQCMVNGRERNLVAFQDRETSSSVTTLEINKYAEILLT